jgi:hypothetical protein
MNEVEQDGGFANPSSPKEAVPMRSPGPCVSVHLLTAGVLCALATAHPGVALAKPPDRSALTGARAGAPVAAQPDIVMDLAPTQVLDSSTMSTTSPEDEERWNLINNNGSVFGSDWRHVQAIGLAPARSAGILSQFDEYFPIEAPSQNHPSGYGVKRTVIGRIFDFHQTGVNCPGYLLVPDECAVHAEYFNDFDYDFNLYPSQSFASALGPIPNPDRTATGFVHCEIYEPQNAIPFFMTNIKENSYVGVYGPWIVDDNRFGCNDESGAPPPEVPWYISLFDDFEGACGRHVEIHPAEQIWFGRSDAAVLIHTADYSNRFNTADHFNTTKARSTIDVPHHGVEEAGPDNCGDGPPTTFTTAWAATPLNDEFAVPFLHTKEAPPIYFDLDEYLGWLTTTPAGITTRTRNLVSRGSSGDTTLITVESRSASAGILFRDVKRRADGSVQGYVIVSSRVGSAGSNGGFAAYLLTKGHAPQSFETEVVSIKRLLPNRYEVASTAGRMIYYPPESSKSTYDDETATISISTGKTTKPVKLRLKVGEQQRLQGVMLQGYAGPFDPNLMTLTAQDADGRPLGRGLVPVRIADQRRRTTESSYEGVTTIVASYPAVVEDDADQGDRPVTHGHRSRPTRMVPRARFEVRYRVSDPRFLTNVGGRQ